MRITIEFDGKRFALESDGGNLATIALLEIAKDSLITKGKHDGSIPGMARKVDFVKP
ncbi:MAG: hypothetical protein V3U41_10610 [candidate division NC10 bacterium]